MLNSKSGRTALMYAASTAADETVASYYTLIYIQQFQESLKFKVEREYLKG